MRSALTPAQRALPLLAVGLIACTGAPWPYGPEFDGGQLSCTSDAQCSDGRVCFIDGCGDPGENLAVEVVPQQGTGEAQDFPIAPGELRAFQIFDLFPPSVLQGEISVATVSGPQPYQGSVSISIRGESAVIPGIRRRYDLTSMGSSYSAHVGAGLYVVTARATEDLTIPPVVIRNLHLGPGDTITVPILFPGEQDLIHLEGRVVRTDALDPVQAALELQVIDEETQEALSQRVPISETGAFSVSAQYPRAGANRVALQVTPKDPAALVPRRQFTVELGGDTLEAPLIFGDFGSAVAVSGRVVDALDAPVSGARVSLSGPVSNGGTFQAAPTLTGVDGTFQLQTLAGDPEVPMSLTIVPPPESESGLTVANAAVPFSGGALGEFTVVGRTRVTSQVLRPDGTPAVGVRVVAEPVSAVEGEPLPGATLETRTDLDGMITLLVDPAVYRVDLSPGENLPRLTRFVPIQRVIEDGAPVPQTLPNFVLSAGRTVEGQVTIRQPGLTDEAIPAAHATVRFFRVSPFEDGPGLLLAEGVANASGAFSVVLPTR